MPFRQQPECQSAPSILPVGFRRPGGPSEVAAVGSGSPNEVYRPQATDTRARHSEKKPMAAFKTSAPRIAAASARSPRGPCQTTPGLPLRVVMVTMGPPMAVYPKELEREIGLRDGARLRLRPIRPEDQDRLIAFYDRLSRHTAYQRFFTVMKRLPPDWAHLLANVDYQRRLALIAEHGPVDAPELVGVARYEPTDRADTAEVAFVIQDGWQNRGLGTTMLDELLAAAEARGIRRFRAWVLANNIRMIDLLARFTDVRERRTESGVAELVFGRKAAPTTR